jgi:hypothetical protein
MKPLPANNGSALPDGESDLEAIIERIAPERRVDFLRWRERVKRHGDNDELLAVVGYLDTSVVLMDLLSREAQPEAIKRALAAVEKASKDQAAAAARIPLLTLVLNTATLIITAVLGMAIGVLIMVLHQTHIDQEHAKAPEARLARDLATIGGSIAMMYPKTAAQSCSEFSRAEPERCGALKLMRRIRAPSRFTTQLG